MILLPLFKVHLKINHEGIKPKKRPCPICNKEVLSLKKHTDAVHDKKKPHACYICDMRFSQASILKTHLKGRHKNDI